MTRDELEILITQSLDGLASPQEQAKLDEALARDPEAVRLMEEYRSLDGLLKTAPMPEINFEQLGARISAAVRDADAVAAHVDASQDDAGQEDTPAIYRLPRWVAWAAPLAAAACVAIVAGVWWSSQHTAPTGGTSPIATNAQPTDHAPVTPPALVGKVQIAVMPAEPNVNRSPVASVEIGPSAGMAQLNLPAREALTPPRSTVAIDSAASTAQDTADHSLFR